MVWNKSVNTIDEIKSLSEKDIDEARARLAELSEHVASSISGMKALTGTLDRADLPARLGRTEDALSTLNTSMQNIFGRIDFLEAESQGREKSQLLSEKTLGQLNELKKVLLVFLGFSLVVSSSSYGTLFQVAVEFLWQNIEIVQNLSGENTTLTPEI
jgi:chromosome segregation ATPase